MTIEIPGRQPLVIKHIVLDYNGTIATDGKISQKTKEKLIELSKVFSLHVLTADTNNSATAECEGLPLSLNIFPNEEAGASKRKIIQKLNPSSCACFGNGFNDAKMFEAAAISVGIIGKEGMSTSLINHADILATDIDYALDLFLNTNKLIATLRT